MKSTACPWDTARTTLCTLPMAGLQKAEAEVGRETPATSTGTRERPSKTSRQYLLCSSPGQGSGTCSCEFVSRDFSLFLLFPAAEASWEAGCKAGSWLAASAGLASGKDPVGDSERTPFFNLALRGWAFPTAASPLQGSSGSQAQGEIWGKAAIY